MRTTLYALARVPFESSYLSLNPQLSAEQWNAFLTRGVTLSPELREIIETLDASSVRIRGTDVSLSGQAGMVVWALCKTDCVIADYDTEFSQRFFADLLRQSPDLNLEPSLKQAWAAFCKIVDLNGMYTQDLPWWVQTTAQIQRFNAGLLNPREVETVAQGAAELYETLGESLTRSEEHDDLQRSLAIIKEAAASGCWLLGWEPQG